jgi:glycerophosphoryl diester phosphodiesterase
MALVIAHRGYSGYYPENSLLALEKAIKCGADGVEIDVRITKDRKLILFHDKDLKNLVGEKGRVDSKTYAEISGLRSRGEPIPLLHDALAYLQKAEAKMIILDVKDSKCERELVRLISGLKLPHLLVSSTDADFLKRLKKKIPHLKIAYVMDNRPDRLRTWRKLHAEVGLYSLHPYHQRPIFTGRLISSARKKGIKVMPWFLRNSRKPKRVKELIRSGIDGIITDFPDEAMKIIREMKK